MCLAQFFNKNNKNELENRLITIDNNILNIYIPTHIDPFIAPLKLPFSIDTILESRCINTVTHYKVVFPDEFTGVYVDVNSVYNFNHRFSYIKQTEQGREYIYNDCLTLLIDKEGQAKQCVPNKYSIVLNNSLTDKLCINKL
jgi:hypothetical protein